MSEELPKVFEREVIIGTCMRLDDTLSREHTERLYDRMKRAREFPLNHPFLMLAFHHGCPVPFEVARDTGLLDFVETVI